VLTAVFTFGCMVLRTPGFIEEDVCGFAIAAFFTELR